MYILIHSSMNDLRLIYGKVTSLRIPPAPYPFNQNVGMKNYPDPCADSGIANSFLMSNCSTVERETRVAVKKTFQL